MADSYKKNSRYFIEGEIVEINYVICQNIKIELVTSFINLIFNLINSINLIKMLNKISVRYNYFYFFIKHYHYPSLLNINYLISYLRLFNIILHFSILKKLLVKNFAYIDKKIY